MIGTIMLIPMVQGTLRYMEYTKDAQSAKAAGELWAFASAILPFVNEVDPAAAEALYKRAWLLDFSGDKAADKALLEATYPSLGAGVGKGMITCEAVGDLYSDPKTVLSAGTCYDSPITFIESDGGMATIIALAVATAILLSIAAFGIVKKGK